VVDLAGPLSDGSLVVATAGRLALLSPSGSVTPFARGTDGYSTARGTEPYLALPDASDAAAGSCTFPTGALFAIEPLEHPGVIMISTTGVATRFATFRGRLMPNGITYDGVGRFGHRLIVTAKNPRSHTASVFAIDCRGKVTTLTAFAPTLLWMKSRELWGRQRTDQ